MQKRGLAELYVVLLLCLALLVFSLCCPLIHPQQSSFSRTHLSKPMFSSVNLSGRFPLQFTNKVKLQNKAFSLVFEMASSFPAHL